MKRLIPLALLFGTLSAQAASVNGYDLSFYGFLKSSAMYADQALGSYNNINLSAPTHATAQTRGQDKNSRLSFQTQQSRLGTTLKKDQVSAKFEFDFIDFNKSSPTTQMNPRVRIASVTYAWDNQKVIIGQDWDMFSPVTTYTFDYVGLYFLAGNTGFMRQQAQYIRTEGDWEMGAALGMAGNNPASSDRDLEQGKSPTYAARIARKLQNGQVGLSGIYSSIKYELENGTRHDSYGANGFYEQVFDRLSVKSEIYYGQNLANLGTLSIGRGDSTRNVKEFGGTLTGSYKLNDTNSIFGGSGIARAEQKAKVIPFALSTTGTIDSAGIEQNILSRVGWDHRVTPDLSVIAEVSRYQTTSKISATKDQLNVASSAEVGIQFRF